MAMSKNICETIDNEILRIIQKGQYDSPSLIAFILRYFDLLFECLSNELSAEQISDIDFFMTANMLAQKETFFHKSRIHDRWVKELNICGGVSQSFAKEELIKCLANFRTLFGNKNNENRFFEENLLEDLEVNSLKLLTPNTLCNIFQKAKIEAGYNT